MKANIIILFLLTSLASATAQKKMDEPYVIWDRTRPVISIVNLRTGEAIASPALKENPMFSPRYNKEQNSVFIMTKHFGYQLDATTGKILIEYQFTDILQKKAGDLTDPNSIIPVYLNEHGIGFFYNINESIPPPENDKPDLETDLSSIKNINEVLSYGSQYHYVTLKKIDISKKTVNDFTVFNLNKYHIYGMENNILHRKHKHQSGSNTFTLDMISIDKYYIIKTLNIPIQLPANKFNITLKDIIDINYLKTENDTITLTLTKTNSDFTSVKLFLYSYNTKEKKTISLKEYNVRNTSFNCGLDCKNTYVAKLIIPEKPPMPVAPDMYIPKRYNKKARAEAERINDERSKEYKKQLEEWYKKNSDRSNNFTNLYIIENGEKKLLKSFQGVTGVTVYEDRYVFYNDDLEYIMYDLEANTILWSILK